MRTIKSLLERDWAAAGKTAAKVAAATQASQDLDLWSSNIEMLDFAMVPIEAHVWDDAARKQRLIHVPLTNRTAAISEIVAAYLLANP